MEFKLPKRIDNSNKSTYGRVLNIAGSDYMPGAALLSSVSALKVGCGYCYLCSTERVINAVSAQTQNVVFVPLNKLYDYMITCDVISIGCGLSIGNTAQSIFCTTIKTISQDKPIIIDADGINLLPEFYNEYTSRKLFKVILTPHPKEAARLLDCSLDDVLGNISDSAREITKLYNCVTVLKTHQTFVCAPDGREFTNNTGNNCMAKAGSGDVLTGIISGLVAQKMDLFEAACLGVNLHGMCGDLAKEKLTEYCVMASDLISFIPHSAKMYIINND